MEWRKNLYDYEATPPNDTWEKISREIENDVPAIREALYDYAEEPPALTWLAIEGQLDKAIVTPLNRYRKPLAYVTAAAAVLSGLIFFSDIFNKDQKGSVAPELSASVYKPVQPSAPVEPAENNSQTIADDPSEPASEKSPAPEKVPVSDQRNETKRAIASIQPLSFDPDDENYIYLTSANGEVKRISYKFEEMIPEMKKQNSELIRKWKQKLESSAFIPAGDNFFDIAEMVKILQEEKRP